MTPANMSHSVNPEAKTFYIETGNMLSMNNITLKVWQSPVDEVRLTPSRGRAECSAWLLSSRINTGLA